jgi:hypothetical protein
MDIEDIKKKEDLRHFQHWKVGDEMEDGKITDIAIVQHDGLTATVLFFDTGYVGSIIVPKPYVRK